MPILTISGIDGSGKGTNIDLVAQRLRDQGLNVKILAGRFGYTPILLKVKYYFSRMYRNNQSSLKLLKEGNSVFRRRGVLWKITACLDYFLYYGVYVRALNVFESYIIIDRYIIDMKVDIMIGSERLDLLDRAIISFLNVMLPKPRVSIFLSIDSSCSEKRSRLKEDEYRESLERIQKRLSLYDLLLTNEIVVDASSVIASVNNKVCSVILK